MLMSRARADEATTPPRTSGTDRNDADLIRRCLGGEQAAWNEMIERYGRLVYSIPRRYGLDSADADDVFQAVFSILYRRLAALRDHDRLSSWLITTAHRESWRVGKKTGRYEHLDEKFVDVSEPQADQAERWEQQHIVRAGLAELGGRCEELLSALFLENKEPSYDEIAARLNMRIGSIGPTRARCFEKLEAILRRRGL